jgi:hypothetical protein
MLLQTQPWPGHAAFPASQLQPAPTSCLPGNPVCAILGIFDDFFSEPPGSLTDGPRFVCCVCGVTILSTVSGMAIELSLRELCINSLLHADCYAGV